MNNVNNKRKGSSDDDLDPNKKARGTEDVQVLLHNPEDARAKYYAVPGVAYELDHCFHWKEEFLKDLPDDMDEKEELKKYVGEYDVIFYKSDKETIEDECNESGGDDDSYYWGEDIQRTTKGEAKFAIQSWGGKSVLRGAFRLADKTIANKDKALSFIQTKSILDEETLLEKYFDWVSPKLDGGSYLMRRDWDMDSEWYKNEDDTYYNPPHGLWDGECCFATCSVQVFHKTKPLVLSTDMIHGIDFSPPQPSPPINLKTQDTTTNIMNGDDSDANEENHNDISVDTANKIMEEYNDRHKKSWMVTHLDIPSEIASLILSYTSPPPFFYLEKGDILLKIVECRRVEWHKFVVLRKRK